MSDNSFKKRLEKMKVFSWSRRLASTYEESADNTVMYGVRSINDVLRAVRPPEPPTNTAGMLTKAVRKPT